MLDGRRNDDMDGLIIDKNQTVSNQNGIWWEGSLWIDDLLVMDLGSIYDELGIGNTRFS
jgi:hypothetical protein